MKCPNCGTENIAGAAFCDNCGEPLSDIAPETPPAPATSQPTPPPTAAEPTEIICPSCGASNQPGDNFCTNCGMSLAEAETAAKQPQVVEQPKVEEEEVEVATPTAAEVAGGVVCPDCKTVNQPGDRFCINCGRPLPTTQIAPETEPAEVAEEEEAEEVAAVAPPGAVLTVTTPAANGKEYTVDQDEAIIGRFDPETGDIPDIDLDEADPEQYVSRKHAKLIRKDDKFLLEHLSASNPTFVNRQKIAPSTPCELKDGDSIVMGKTRLKFTIKS